MLVDDPTWGGVLRGGLLLGVLWWAWSAYAWLTNTLDPEEGGVRMVMLAAIGGHAHRVTGERRGVRS